MMTDQKIKNLKRGSFIALAVALVSIGLQIAGYFQTRHLLASPLISKTTIDEIARPYLQSAVFSSVIFLIALLFHHYKKYIIAIVIFLSIILFQQVYISLVEM